MKFKHVVILIMLAAMVFSIGCGGGGRREEAPPPPPPPPPDTTTQAPPPPEPPPTPPLQLTTIYFDYDKADIRADARNIMAQNGQSLTDHPDVTIRIEGHCDERGTDEYNMALGERRANAARDYLANYGIQADRMSTISYGESRPVAAGHNEEAWAQNRRAEFKVVSE